VFYALALNVHKMRRLVVVIIYYFTVIDLFLIYSPLFSIIALEIF